MRKYTVLLKLVNIETIMKGGEKIMNGIKGLTRRLYYHSRGIDPVVLDSKKDGTWLHQKREENTVGFLRFKVANNERKNLVRLVDLVERLFSFKGEILGRNENGKRLVEVKIPAFSGWQQEEVKKKVENLLEEEEISGVVVQAL